MKAIISLALLVLCLPIQASPAQSIDELVKQVRKEAVRENQHNKEREKRFIVERNQQKNRLADLKQKLSQAEEKAKSLREAFNQNEKSLIELDSRLGQEAGNLSDLSAIARQSKNELHSLLSRSMVTAQFPNRTSILDQLDDQSENSILSIDELKNIWLLLLEEMNQTGKVVRFDSPVITAKGEEAVQQVTRAGVFTATSEGNFLRYLPETGKLVELARQPAARFQDMAYQLEQAESGVHAMAIDPTKGAILSLLVQSPNLKERVQQGGNIGYLILLFGLLGLLIVVYRYFVLFFTGWRINRQLKNENPKPNNPLGRLISTSTGLSNVSSEALTISLDETINTESTKLHFGLKTLTVFAAITPLLGLLGTVTGMIETFQSISLFGTGDPKLMSSGISQALVTTQLGLAVAIPLILFHSFLQGKANGLVGILDEQSVRLFENHEQKVMSRECNS